MEGQCWMGVCTGYGQGCEVRYRELSYRVDYGEMGLVNGSESVSTVLIVGWASYRRAVFPRTLLKVAKYVHQRACTCGVPLRRLNLVCLPWRLCTKSVDSSSSMIQPEISLPCCLLKRVLDPRHYEIATGAFIHPPKAPQQSPERESSEDD